MSASINIVRSLLESVTISADIFDVLRSFFIPGIKYDLAYRNSPHYSVELAFGCSSARLAGKVVVCRLTVNVSVEESIAQNNLDPILKHGVIPEAVHVFNESEEVSRVDQYLVGPFLIESTHISRAIYNEGKCYVNCSASLSSGLKKEVEVVMGK